MSASSSIESLKKQLKGDVFTEPLRRGVYSTDASIYQMFPLAVIFPKDKADLELIMAYCRKESVPILARGGGTSLAGQTVSDGIVLDFTTYMHKVVEFDPKEKWMSVEPGITRDEVNVIAAEHNLEFAPDPATSSRATVGGMIANNSSGTKSILYGKTIDHVRELTVLLPSGEIVTWGDMTPSSIERDPLKSLDQITATNAELIREKYPKTMRRVNGYCLDELLDKEPWQPQRIFVGSEGTLGIILEAKINLVPLPRRKAVAVVHFSNTHNAVEAVSTMLNYKPAAVEILSDTLLNYSKKNLATRDMCSWINGEPKSVQIVEFYAEDKEDIDNRASRMFEELKSLGLGYAFDLYHDGDDYNHVWSIRKKGLGLLMGEPNERRGIAFIEDAAIPVEVLPEYIDRVLEVCARYDVEATYYAHASVGVIHVRPIMDMRQHEDIEKMKLIAQDVFDLVMEYKGAWSGEHGDGLVRSPFLRQYFGDQLYGVLGEVKRLFDPQNIMNPGKIVDAPAMDQNLRYGAEYQDNDFEAVYRYPEQKNFQTAVHQCTGIGACRKIQGGTMCPSYMATRDELHSTRGRANALRLAMSGQLSDQGLADPALLDAMDLCLSCKGCKAECPSSVDMARLKSEVLQVHYDKNGPSLRDKLIGDSSEMASRMAGPLAGIVNGVQGSTVFRSAMQSMVGIDKRRKLPTYATETFSTWFRKNYRDKGLGHRVGLFADTYMNFHEPSIGKAAVRLIQHLGYDIDLLEGCCQRPKISHGFLRDAGKQGRNLLEGFGAYKGQIIACEPGCVSALCDDLPDLAQSDLAEEGAGKVLPVELWVRDKIIAKRSSLKPAHSRLFLHGHCHQKALYSTRAIHEIFEAMGAQVYEPDSGCCGMGGSFGYEKEHYDISKDIAERVLLKELRSHDDAFVIASGFSCRHQIEHFSGRKAVHWLEAIAPIQTEDKSA